MENENRIKDLANHFSHPKKESRIRIDTITHSLYYTHIIYLGGN